MNVQDDVKDGFVGQRMIVLPAQVNAAIQNNPLINRLYLTDVGFFPQAMRHVVVRDKGAREYILLLCSTGGGRVEVADAHYKLKANTFYIIEKQQAHAYYAMDKKPWSLYWLHFSGSYSDIFFEHFTGRYKGQPGEISSRTEVIQLFDTIMDTLENGYSTANIEYSNLLLWSLLTQLMFSPPADGNTTAHTENDTIKKAVIYMKDNLHNPQNVNDIAGLFNCSPSHFYSLFKKHTGYTPIVYFNNLKIQKACQYLSFTSLSVKEISFRLGYNDPLYFSRLFSSIMQISPMGYRKNAKR